MADVKKGSDLITTMGATEKRMKKLERQLAVSRRGASSIIAATAPISAPGTPVAIGLDSVTVVCTANCLVHVYVQLQMASAFGTGTVFLRDVTASTNIQILVSSSTNQTRATVAGSNTGVDITTALGGTIIIPITTAGPRNYSLFCSTAGGGVNFSNRLLTAFVQPF